MAEQPSIEQRVVMLQWRPMSAGVTSWCTSTPQEFASMIEDEDSEIFQIRLVRMTESEVEALPEFEGW